MAGNELRYCGWCASLLHPRTIGSPPTARLVCEACGRVTYRNPAVGVAVVLVRDGRVLLGRRSRGAYRGRWCIPCGYVEWDEEIRTAARREMLEETGLVVEIGEVCAVHSNFHDRERQTVGVWFWGRIVEGLPTPGDDLDRLDHFLPCEPPPLAFPTDALVLEALAARPPVS